MKFKRLLSLVASAAMTISALCGAMSITASAYTNGDLTYEVAEGVLKISVTDQDEGNTKTAAMNDFTSATNMPWYSSRNSITKVEIGEGVTSIGNYAFDTNFTKITEVVLPSTLKTIGDRAFYQCSGLTTISYTEKAQETAPVITKFGADAFNNCKLLATVPEGFLTFTSEEGVTIGSAAFQSCSALKVPLSFTMTSTYGSSYSLSLGQSAFQGSGITSLAFTKYNSKFTEIPASCFRDCASLTEIKSFPSIYFNKIGNYAFSGCSTLTTVPSLSSVDLGDYAFQNCIGLTAAPALGTSRTLGTGIFSGCTGIESANVNMTNVPNQMFSGCTSLATVTFGSSVTTIGSSAFNGTPITAADLSSSKITTVGSSAFSNCTSLESASFPSTLTTIDSSAFNKDTALETVEIVGGLKKIGSSAFSGCSALKSITLPNALSEIGSSAFASCSSLKFIQIPSGLTELGTSIFSNCTALANVDFAPNVESFGTNLFQNCTSLKSLQLPKALKTLDSRAFAGCTNLKNITADPESEFLSNPSSSSYGAILLSKDGKQLVAASPGVGSSASVSYYGNIEKVCDYAFYNFTNLTSASFPTSNTGYLKEVGKYAFSGTGISSASFGPSIEVIDNYAFASCAKLSSVSGINYENFTKIGTAAFQGTKISSVTVGSTSTTIETQQIEIGNNAFQNCSSLSTVTFNNVIKSVGGYAFQNCTSLKKIVLPNNIESIGQYIFAGCTSLASATLPNKITVLPAYAFQKCSALVSVNIPSSVTEIGNYAFSESGVQRMTISNNVKTLGTYVFNGCSSLEECVLGTKITTIPVFTFSGCTNTNLKIYLMGTISDIGSNSNSFGSNASTYVKGTVYVYDETTYNKVILTSAYTGNSCKVVYGADFTALRALLAEANEMYDIDYTPETFSILVSARNLAELTSANYAANQVQADTAITGLQSAIAQLVALPNDEWLATVNAEAEYAETLERTDYRAESFANFRTATLAAEAVTGDEVNSVLRKLYNALKDAEENLVLSYEYRDPVMIVKSATAAHGNWSQLQGYTYPAMEGMTGAAAVGTTKVKVILDVADYVTPNAQTYLECRSFIEGTDEQGVYKNWTASSRVTINKGKTDVECVYNLSHSLDAETFAYHIYCSTMCWQDKKEGAALDYAVFYIKEMQLLNAEDEVLFSTKNWTVPNEDLTAAVEDARGYDQSLYTPESAQVLQDAIEAAEAILAQEKPTVSSMNNAQMAIEDAIWALEEAGDTPPVDDKTPAEKLDESVKSAEAAIADADKYTPESVQKVKDAIEAANALPEDATDDQIAAAQKAVDEAVAALAPAQSAPTDPSDPTDPTDPTDPSVKPTDPTAATRSPEQVKKDKDAADKAMKQAKITKLNAKAKGKKKAKITWKSVKNAVGYEVQVSPKKNFSKKVVKKTTSKTKITIKKLKSKTKYFVRVRAYTTYKNAKNVTVKVYSKWNKKLRKVKVK